MLPELNVLLFEVDVCVTLSLFVHVTVVPAVMLSGFGRYASAPSVDAPPGMATPCPVPGFGVGDGVGVGVGFIGLLYDEPQPALKSATTAVMTKRFLDVMNISPIEQRLSPRRLSKYAAARNRVDCGASRGAILLALTRFVSAYGRTMRALELGA